MALSMKSGQKQTREDKKMFDRKRTQGDIASTHAGCAKVWQSLLGGQDGQSMAS